MGMVYYSCWSSPLVLADEAFVFEALLLMYTYCYWLLYEAVIVLAVLLFWTMVTALTAAPTPLPLYVMLLPAGWYASVYAAI